MRSFCPAFNLSSFQEHHFKFQSFSIYYIKRCIMFFRKADFSGILNNSEFAKEIQKSFANQTLTVARTVEDDSKLFTFKCMYCRAVVVDMLGEYDCPHCGGGMMEEQEK